MAIKWKKIAIKWAQTAVMALVIPAIVSYFVSNRVDQNSKVREAQSIQIAKFASGNDSIFVSATDFISAVTPSNFTPSHEKLRRDFVHQIQITDNPLLYFRDKKVGDDVKSYKEILDQSLSALDDAEDPVKLVKWANTLSKLNDAKLGLVRELLETSQISS